MMGELEPKYLLDECIQPGLMDLWSGEYVELSRVLPHGSSDEIVFEESKKRGLIVITRDRGFVAMAMRENTPIIWQYGDERFLIHGMIVEKNYAMKSHCTRTKNLLRCDTIILP